MSSPNAASAGAGTAPASSISGAAWLTPVELTLLGAIWGASFLFMRVAAKDFGPFALVEIRLAFGAIILLPFLWRARAQFTGALWLKLTGIAAINSALPFTLFAWGAERAPAGIGAITNAMAVPFTALVAFLFFHEEIGKRRAAGLLLGFIGVAVLASGRTGGGAEVWPAALAGATAAFMYGIGGNLLRRYLAGIPASAIAAASLIGASILEAPLAIATWPGNPIPMVSWVCAALLGVLCTGLAYVLYFRLIHRVGAPRAVAVTYIIPLFGVLWAWMLLGEALTWTMAVAGALILAGVAMNQTRRRTGA
jgi:drug/metabolite transporter (DMT)-like permease